MAYQMGDRKQRQLLPSSVEEFVSADDPARAYDAFAECLDLAALGFEIDPHRVGRPEFDPRSMLKLLVYGYAYGIRSSRKLERATHHNLSFVWLMGGLKPDHKTIARFRRDHREALAQVLRQCAQVCLRLGLIEGNTLFVDGTKVRANASIKHTWTEKRCAQSLQQIDERIESILHECEQIDETEQHSARAERLPLRLQAQQRLRSEIQAVLQQLQSTERSAINTTDPDAGRMRTGTQIEPGYNCQSVVDDQYGLIVHADVLNAGNDVGQFAAQIDQAQETLGRHCETACADAGYSSPADLETVLDQGVDVVVPIVRHSDFRDHFRFDAARNEYVCPEGHRLAYLTTHADHKSDIYAMRNASTCVSCPRFGNCTRSRQGRRVERPYSEAVRERLEQRNRQPSATLLMRRRKMRAEHPFGHIKHNLGMRTFLLRSRSGVRAEMALAATAFNLRRMMSLLGIAGLINQLRSQ